MIDKDSHVIRDVTLVEMHLDPAYCPPWRTLASHAQDPPYHPREDTPAPDRSNDLGPVLNPPGEPDTNEPLDD